MVSAKALWYIRETHLCCLEILFLPFGLFPLLLGLTHRCKYSRTSQGTQEGCLREPMAKSLGKLEFIPGEPSVQGNHQAGLIHWAGTRIHSWVQEKGYNFTLAPSVYVQNSSDYLYPDCPRVKPHPGDSAGREFAYRVRSLWFESSPVSVWFISRWL